MTSAMRRKPTATATRPLLPVAAVALFLLPGTSLRGFMMTSAPQRASQAEKRAEAAPKGRRELLGAAALLTSMAQSSPASAMPWDKKTEDVIATFTVNLEGDHGDKIETVNVRLRRDWAPRGVKRFKQLASMGEFQNAVIYHKNSGFARFGVPADASLPSPGNFKNELVRASNKRGTLTFEKAGLTTRNGRLFFNVDDNEHLDRLGYAPIGEVIGDGMKVVDQFYGGYGASPSLQEGYQAGNKYFDEDFPKLTKIQNVEIGM